MQLRNIHLPSDKRHIDMYFSFDVESSGVSPYEHSLIALGIVACAKYDGKTFQRMDVDNPNNGFYSLIKELPGRRWNEESAEIHAIDRQELAVHGYDASMAMLMMSEWVRRVADGVRPVAVAYPLGFDWSFLYSYACQFLMPQENPFGFSGCLDIKTLYAAKSGNVIINCTKRQMPKKLRSTRPHTHNALDDAKEQADLFCNLMEWEV